MATGKSKVEYELQLQSGADLDLLVASLAPKSLSELCIEVIVKYIGSLIEECPCDLLDVKVPNTQIISPSPYEDNVCSSNVDNRLSLAMASSDVQAVYRYGLAHFVQSSPILSKSRVMKIAGSQASRVLQRLVEEYWESSHFSKYISLFHSRCFNLPSDVVIHFPKHLPSRGLILSVEEKKSMNALSCLADFPLQMLKLCDGDQSVMEHILPLLCQSFRKSSSHLCYLGLIDCDVSLSSGTVSDIRVLIQNVTYLNLSGTRIDDKQFADITNAATRLQHIDISYSQVTNLEPLVRLKDSLRCLILHQVAFRHGTGIPVIVCHLKQLRQLDLSWSPERHILHDEICTQEEIRAFVSSSSLENLQILDLAGNRLGMTSKSLRKFLDNHPRVEKLSISSWIQARHVLDTEMENVYRRSKNIHIAGDENATLLNSLRWHSRRSGLIQFALHLIFEWTQDEKVEHPILLQHVLHCMGQHMTQTSLILASTAVVYNLTRAQKSQQLPQYLLNWAVHATLKAIEQYPNHRQMLKNCFLTLCTDIILHKANFSRIQCCMLVFNGLLHQSDAHVKRMGVAILSILAADLSPVELRDITKNEQHLRKLIQFVAEKSLTAEDLRRSEHEYLRNLVRGTEAITIPHYDLVLRFTLSAIWNLTDECEDACNTFIRNGGLYVFEKVFKNFDGFTTDSRVDVYGKCLGLLNNIAEFDNCRKSLFRVDLMNIFMQLLNDEAIQIRYFVVGILAHQSLEDDICWIGLSIGREATILELCRSVSEWDNPDMDMVAYRSFRPFERLITHPRASIGALHWCLWAIRHVFMRKASRYIPLLNECPLLLDFVKKSASSLPDVDVRPDMDPLTRSRVCSRDLAQIILHRMESVDQCNQ